MVNVAALSVCLSSHRIIPAVTEKTGFGSYFNHLGESEMFVKEHRGNSALSNLFNVGYNHWSGWFKSAAPKVESIWALNHRSEIRFEARAS